MALRVAPGFYPEDITITRDTQIFGLPDPVDLFAQVFIQGSVRNTGPRLLEVQDVFLIWEREERAVGVFVDNPCAVTRMRNVVVRGFRGFGIRQRGGSLSLVNVRVSSTKANPEPLVEGTGILLSCGTRANMSDVTLDFNETSGLSISGMGTEVHALNLVVGGTRVHPIFRDLDTEEILPWGGVYVNDGAHLEVHGFRFEANVVYGVRVENHGTAFLEFGTVAGTQGLNEFFHDEDRQFVGGHNVAVYASAYVRMEHVICTRAYLCGILIARDGEMDYLGRSLSATGSTSEVSHNATGVCLQVAGYDIRRLQNGVLYRDNGTTLEATSFPVPAPASLEGP